MEHLKLFFLAVMLSIGLILASINPRFVVADHSTIVVPDDCPTIQQAINMANDGDTIFVRKGTYYENVVVSRPVNLVGQSNEDTVVDGRELGTTFLVTARNVNITGFRIIRSESAMNEAGIVVNGPNVRIFGNTLNYCWNSIILSCTNVTVEGNTIKYGRIRGDSIGVVAGGSNITICGNLLTDGDAPIVVEGSNVLIMNNTVVRNKRGIEFDSGSNCVARNNVIANNSYLGIVVFSGTRVELHDNLVTNGKYGAMLSSNNTVVVNCTFAANEVGVWADRGGNTLYGNAFIGNKEAVRTAPGNYWHGGYPLGGNYWSDHTGTDEYQGPNQDQPGADGIADEPYAVDGGADRYPLMKPVPVFERELAASVWVPDLTPVGTNASLEAVICNLGSTDESNVILQLFIDKSLAQSTEFPLLPVGATRTFNFSFSPSAPGMFEIMVSATLIVGERTYENNVQVTYLNVYEIPTGMPRICVDPPPAIAFVGGTVTVTVMVENVQRLRAWQVYMSFDSSVLAYSCAWVPTVNVLASHAYSVLPFLIKEDRCGTVFAAGATFIGNPGISFSGSGVFCRINFTVVAEGESLLRLLEPSDAYDFATYMLNPDFGEIACECVDGAVTARVYPGDVTRDGKVDIQDLARATSAFGSYPGHLNWNPNADLDHNDRVNIMDIAIVSKNYGAHP